VKFNTGYISKSVCCTAYPSAALCGGTKNLGSCVIRYS